jgi:hypothetical protein
MNSLPARKSLKVKNAVGSGKVESKVRALMRSASP